MSHTEEILDTTVNTTQISEYQYPLQFKFKIGTLSNDFIATDANGKMLAYVRQKMFKLKEAIMVYSDEKKEHLIFKINADRIIDFNASYAFSNENEEVLGHVGRKGMRSLLKAHYEIYDNDKKQEFLIKEENPWTKFWDALLGEVPLLGLFSGYLFNPRYIVKRGDGSEVMRLSKESSFFGRKFKVDKLSDVHAGEDERLMLGLMMMSLLERRRG
ncbi:MAG: LURP-one-related family protein [Crocinitomicaceae bacterium]